MVLLELMTEEKYYFSWFIIKIQIEFENFEKLKKAFLLYLTKVVTFPLLI